MHGEERAIFNSFFVFLLFRPLFFNVLIYFLFYAVTILHDICFIEERKRNNSILNIPAVVPLSHIAD